MRILFHSDDVNVAGEKPQEVMSVPKSLPIRANGCPNLPGSPQILQAHSSMRMIILSRREVTRVLINPAHHSLVASFLQTQSLRGSTRSPAMQAWGLGSKNSG